jgi:hypothetical protein
MNLIYPLVFLQAAAAAPPPPDAAACEAHVFPTDQVEGFTRLGNYGLLSEALAGGPVPQAEMLAQIKADSQFAIAARLFDRAGRLAGFRFVEHREPVAAKTAFKQKARLTPSAAPCYVEIVVNYIAFSDSALSKAKVGVHFATRDFRARPGKPVIRLLGGSAALRPYVAEPQPGSSAPPPVDYVGAYSEAFEAAIARFWKPRA